MNQRRMLMLPWRKVVTASQPSVSVMCAEPGCPKAVCLTRKQLAYPGVPDKWFVAGYGHELPPCSDVYRMMLVMISIISPSSQRQVHPTHHCGLLLRA